MAKNIKIEPIKETTMSAKLVGDTDLILNGRSTICNVGSMETVTR